jgi:hypothetical protein
MMADSSISAQSRRIIARAKDLIDAARSQGITLRVLGGIAVLVHSHEPVPAQLLREVRDADLVVEKGGVKQLARLLRDKGYAENRRFNLLNGNERLIFFDPENETQLDVFVGAFRMCHVLPLEARLGVEPYTLPLAETLLTKLQIVQLNEKDLRDILLLLLQHDVTKASDVEAVNTAALAAPCGRDWGLCRTVTENLVRVLAAVSAARLKPGEEERLGARVRAVQEAIEREPKSAAWRVRSLVGTRVRWYELPEEVTGAITVAND